MAPPFPLFDPYGVKQSTGNYLFSTKIAHLGNTLQFHVVCTASNLPNLIIYFHENRSVSFHTSCDDAYIHPSSLFAFLDHVDLRIIEGLRYHD